MFIPLDYLILNNGILNIMVYISINPFNFLYFITLIIDFIDVSTKKACYDSPHPVQKATFVYDY